MFLPPSVFLRQAIGRHLPPSGLRPRGKKVSAKAPCPAVAVTQTALFSLSEYRLRRARNAFDGAQPIIESALSGFDQDVPDPGIAKAGEPRGKGAVVFAVPAVSHRDREFRLGARGAQPLDYGCGLFRRDTRAVPAVETQGAF